VPPSEQLGPAAGVLARGYAFVVVGLRYLIVGAWAATVVLAILFLPPLNATSGDLSKLIPPGSAAAHAESDAARLFGFPIDAAVAIVQRDPHGMPAAARDRAIRQAVRSLLAPALVALFGRLGMWPGHRRVPPVTSGEAADRQPAVR
jgi:uncharacterized membrane protein YdfJ with MMPL/SSD domain